MPSDIRAADAFVVDLCRSQADAVYPPFPTITADGRLLFRAPARIALPVRGAAILPSGWVVALPPGLEGRVRLEPSGVMASYRLANPPVGTLDSDYRGDLGLIVTRAADARADAGPARDVLDAGAPFLSLEIWPHAAPPTAADSPQPLRAGHAGRGTADAAGSDISTLHDLVVLPGATVWVTTDVQLGASTVVSTMVRSRSGLAAKFGLSLAEPIPCVDRAPETPLRLAVRNWGESTVQLPSGTRFAQLVSTPVSSGPIPVTALRLHSALDRLPQAHSDRVGGFGSTGLHRA